MDNPSQSSVSAPNPESTLHLVFRFDAHLFAIAVSQVAEVVLPGEINPVPGAGKGLCGLMNLRGEALPVLDAGELLGRQRRAPPSREAQHDQGPEHLIIVSCARGTFGLTVDKALKVVGLIPSPLPDEKLSSSVRTYALDGDKTILILEPDTMGSRSFS